MKKRLSLVLAVLGFCVALGATAQDRKSWDFTKGLSAETTANLKADSNWKDSGETDTELRGHGLTPTKLLKQFHLLQMALKLKSLPV